MPDPIEAETQRILHALKAAVEETELSIRAVERKAGVSYTVFQKVLAGSTNLQFHHILQILAATRISWNEFFNLCYPQPEKKAQPEPEPEPVPTAAEKARELVTVGALEERLRLFEAQLGSKLALAPARPAP